MERFNIKTIIHSNEFKFKEKGSTFIGTAFPAQTISEAEEILDTIKKQYYDATHNCYAYKIHTEGEKYSDDGEPNGTAGIRILNGINKFELTNLIVISTRYYGGTKLGVGPLGKAYYDSAFGVLNESKIISLTEYHQIKLSFDYNLLSPVHKLLSDFKVRNIENKYDPNPIIECMLLRGDEEKFKERLIEMTNAQANIHFTMNFRFLND